MNSGKGEPQERPDRAREQVPDSRSGGSSDRGAEPRAIVYCIVPRELAEELHEPLRRHFRDDPGVTVIVERRIGERRSGEDRRRTEAPSARRRDRREGKGPDGRRVAERRATAVRIEAPPLPRRLRRYADRLVFVRRVEPTKQREDLDSTRLALRAQSGEAAAFASLYMRYFDPVYGYMRVALRDVHEAEDLTQQVFTKAFAALKGYERRGGKPFRAWLFRIARNEALSYLRGQGRLEYHEPAALERRLEAEPVAGAGAPPPEEAFDWLTDADLMRWVERLPVPQRQVLTLRYLLGLSAKESATVLDRSPDAVRQLEHRALRFLEQRLTQTRQGSRTMRRTEMVIRMRPLPVLGARRWGLYTGEARRRAGR